VEGCQQCFNQELEPPWTAMKAGADEADGDDDAVSDDDDRLMRGVGKG